MDAFAAYKKYVALKLHFQQDNYDYFKFSGKAKVSREKFETRRDKYYFQRIAKLYDEKQFEMIEKIKSMVGIKKTIKQKEQIEQPESEVRKSLVVKK
jgi:hypothetical protein